LFIIAHVGHIALYLIYLSCVKMPRKVFQTPTDAKAVVGRIEPFASVSN
jgi:hypothetical protein